MEDLSVPRREELQPDSSPVVGISVCDSAPLIWRVQDLKAVRSGGLVGALLGSLPRTPRQNGRLGRPLLLLPEEERLLREGPGAAVLPRPGGERGAELKRRFEEEQTSSQEEQSVLALQDRKAALLRAMTSSLTEEAQQDRLGALDQNFVFPRSALAVQLSTARAGLHYCPEARSFLEAEQPIKTQPSPSSRFQVFRDLRGRGFFLTSAGKFGGDFLVYPGDPLRFHAHFIAVCVESDRPVGVLDLLAVARLGSNVKKTVLLCSPVADGDVRYTSLQWSGMV